MFVLSPSVIINVTDGGFKTFRLSSFPANGLTFIQPKLIEQGGLRDWVNAWKKSFENQHVEELLVMLGHVAMCMKREKQKPLLILCGESGQGKTPLMEFSAEVFGHVSGSAALLNDLSVAGLCGIFSGMPVLLNDPKADSETLKILQKVAVAVFDGNRCALSTKERIAKAFVVASLNDKETIVIIELTDRLSNFSGCLRAF